ncbi:sulfite exporter TauE/SafE family protein [Methanocella arvoryzae]|uniref:sulfite exporter TauE/SafE family protein n=1 Tax=Methanocella arvoryzae TaxID=1175445 RepID=UPI001E635741|nr:sulfite exporter TauE/SafE family protein [Methanocella arvoryzae]
MITGLIAGAFGGLLGLGGAVILVPVLTLGFGLPIHLAIPVSLISNIFVSLTSVMSYRRRGLLHRRTIWIMNVWSVTGIILGTLVAAWSPDTRIKLLFGIFLLFMIAEAVLVKREIDLGEAQEPEKLNVPAFSALGFCMGLLGALLGIGGGTLAVPVQNSLLKVPLRNAIANSLATIVVSASVGAVTYFIVGSGTLFSATEALVIAAAIVPGSVIGAKLATMFSDRLPVRYIRYIFYLVLLYISYNMIRSGMGW